MSFPNHLKLISFIILRNITIQCSCVYSRYILCIFETSPLHRPTPLLLPTQAQIPFQPKKFWPQFPFLSNVLPNPSPTPLILILPQPKANNPVQPGFPTRTNTTRPRPFFPFLLPPTPTRQSPTKFPEKAKIPQKPRKQAPTRPPLASLPVLSPSLPRLLHAYVSLPPPPVRVAAIGLAARKAASSRPCDHEIIPRRSPRTPTRSQPSTYASLPLEWVKFWSVLSAYSWDLDKIRILNFKIRNNPPAFPSKIFFFI